jgi:hypothetical protein
VGNTNDVVLDAIIANYLLALLVLFCSNVMGKVVELLAHVVALYLSRHHSVGEQEPEARDFAEVSAMTGELEVAFVIITPCGIDSINRLT